jgi:hypothetical protein
MTSTLPPDPPNFPGINYNSSFWSNSASTTGLTYNQALKNFLAFPVAQGTETLQNTNVNGTLTIINPLTPSETYSQYVDNAPNLDITLSTTQSAGGLTIRTPTNSFTMNPNTFNQNLVTPAPVTGMQMLNPINMNNFNILNMGQYSTAYTQVNNTNLDYVATCNYVNNMIVNGNGILDNNNLWTGTNTFNNTVLIGSATVNSTINTDATSKITTFSNNNTGGGYTFNVIGSPLTTICNMLSTGFYIYNNLDMGGYIIAGVNQINGTGGNLNTASNLYIQGITYCNVLTARSQTYVITTTPVSTDNSQAIATTEYVTLKVTGATQVARTNLTYSIPNTTTSGSSYATQNTISNTVSTLFFSNYFTPVTTTTTLIFNFNLNIYNGTYQSEIIQNYSVINTGNLQQNTNYFTFTVTSPTQLTLSAFPGFGSTLDAGSQYYINAALEIISS